MRDFYEGALAPASLAKKGAGERLGSYRKLRERYGPLTLGAVIRSTPRLLTVTLIDADTKPHAFTFEVEAGTQRPRLVQVTMKENRPGKHGGLGRFLHR